MGPHAERWKRDIQGPLRRDSCVVAPRIVPVLSHVLHDDILECRFLGFLTVQHAPVAILSRVRGDGVNEGDGQPNFLTRWALTWNAADKYFISRRRPFQCVTYL